MVAICSAGSADTTAEKKTAFRNKYLSEKRIGTDASHLKMLNETDTTTLQSHEFNITKYTAEHDMKAVEQKADLTNSDAQAITTYAHSGAFLKRVGENVEYLLEDKQLDWGKHVERYQPTMERYVKQLKNEGSPYYSKNRFLDADERLIVVISSSMPKETIHQYFEDLAPVNTDVLFVMRGTIGGMSKIMPTMRYIRTLLVKDPDGNLNDNKNYYSHNVTINPKITQRYGIDRVPAVIYVKGYDPVAEATTGVMAPVHDDERVYVSYGDAEIGSVLRTINKQAKSKGIKALLAGMNQSYFAKKKDQ